MVVALSHADALSHPRRQALHEAVLEAPGIGFRSLSRQVGIAAGTVRYHLNVLIRCGLLREERVGAGLAFLPAGDRRDASMVARLREPALCALRDLVASAGRICQRDLLAYLDGIWPRSTIQHRLQRLVHAGVLRVRLQGRFRFYEVVA